MSQSRNDGIFNSSSGCSCHTPSSSLTPTLEGYPSAYVAGTTYTINISSVSPVHSTGGFSLQVTKGELSNPGTMVQISSNKLSATHDDFQRNAWQVDWTAPSTGSGDVTISVAVVNADGGGSNKNDMKGTASVQISEFVDANNPPSVSNVVISPENPTTSDDLVLSYDYSDLDGDEQSGTTIQWFKDGSLVTGMTTATVPSSQTTRGEQWSVVVTPSDGADTGQSVTSATITISNTLPSAIEFVISPTQPATEDDLVVNFSTTDDDGDSISSSLFWKVDGQRIDSLDNLTTVPSLATRIGDTWEAVLVLDDGIDSVEVTSPSVFVGSNNSAPTITSISFTPSTPTSSDDIVVAWTIEDEEGDTEQEHQISWLRGGVEVEEQTRATLPSSSTTKGESWQALVRVFDGFGWSNWTPSELILIQNSPPHLMSITLGSIETPSDEDLTFDYAATDADGDAITIFSVMWNNGEASVDTGISTTLPSEYTEKGDQWSASVVLSDGEDVSEVTTSASVLILNSIPIVAVEFEEQPIAKQDLVPSISFFDADDDSIDYSISWYRNGFRDGTLDDEMVVPASKVGPGQEWKLVIELSDGDDEGQTFEFIVMILNAPPTADFEIQAEVVWTGEMVRYDASTSFDPDGSLVSFAWYLDSGDGQSRFVGSDPVLEIIAPTNFEVKLMVTDSSGATSETKQTFQSTQGPRVSNVILEQSNEKFSLSWAWNGPDALFRIYEDGRLIGETSRLTFDGQSSLAIEQSFSIVPVVNDQELQAGQSQSESVDFSQVQLEAEQTPMLPMLFSTVILLAGAVVFLLMFRKGASQ
ncbi:MAG: choice-of-anchor V domain-containing protein [Candidatus Poseidoniales archaeon]